MDDELPEHVRENRAYWDAMADQWVMAGERSWSRDEPHWGVYQRPESELGMLPQSMSGLHSIELGCGTGYVSAWMVRRGATAVGIDNSERQLATARRLSQQHGLELTLHHGTAERVPYPDAHFDFAISEYGAATWCDPRVWIPEAHRLLKPGGQLVFLGNSPLAMVCTPPDGSMCDERLHRSYFELHRMDWRNVDVDPGGIEFNLPVSGWFRLFAETGFRVLDYQEIRAPDNSPDAFGVPGSWAHHYPAEQVWKLQKCQP